MADESATVATVIPFPARPNFGHPEDEVPEMTFEEGWAFIQSFIEEQKAREASLPPW